MKSEYHFRLLWHSRHGAVDTIMILSAADIQTLGAIVFDRNEVQKYLKPFEEKRIKPIANLSYLVEVKQPSSELVKTILDFSSQQQLSPSHINLNRGGIHQAKLPEFPAARAPVNSRIKESAQYEKYFVYHTPNQDRIFLLSPEGELEIRDGTDIEKLLLKIDASPPRRSKSMGRSQGSAPEERQNLELLDMIYREVNEELYPQDEGGYLLALHFSEDGQYLYLAIHNPRTGGQVAVIRRANNQVLDIIHSGIEDLNEIHSSQDNQFVVFRGWTHSGKISQQRVFKRNELRR